MIAAVLLSLLSVAFHEIAHGVAAALLGGRVREFVLGMPPVVRRLGTVRGLTVCVGRYPLGVAVGIEAESLAALSVRRRVAIWLVAPAVSLALAPVFFALGSPLAALITAALGLTNLVPLPPMDGGQALFIALGVSPERRRRVATLTNRALVAGCGLLLVAAAVLWLVL